jgi:hypothetical protein
VVIPVGAPGRILRGGVDGEPGSKESAAAAAVGGPLRCFCGRRCAAGSAPESVAVG